jgi:single-strand DNA-binding protein
MNVAIFIGRLTRDPELRFLPGNGRAVARFTVAVDKGLSKEKKSEMQAQGKSTADFINIVVWGKQAENCANYLAKGRQVAIEGSIQTGSYTNAQGQKVYTTEVVANKVQFIDWSDNASSRAGSPQGQYSNAPSSQPSNSGFDQLPDGFEPIDDDDIPF